MLSAMIASWPGEKTKEVEKPKEKNNQQENIRTRRRVNEAGYTATLVACGWAGAVLEKVNRASGQKPYAQKAQKRQKSKKGTNQPTDRHSGV